jgi:hypothetical protein
MARTFERLAVALLLGILRVYKLGISPFLGPSCRYAPSCSDYAAEALRVHGVMRGAWLAVRRVLRCHPLGGSGFDPVPQSDGEVEKRRR